MKQSKFLSLGWRDLARAFLTAFIALVLDFAQTTIVPSLNVSPEIKLMVITALAYLSKNFFTPKDKAE
jgi:hypothetical protein